MFSTPPRYFQHPNQELYALMASLGPDIGWSGDFPRTFRESQQRKDSKAEHRRRHGGLLL